MAYTANLHGNLQLTIANRDTQTSITLVSNSPGQQQSQSSSMTTGHWTKPPQLWQTPSGFLLQIDSDRGQYFIQVQASGMQTLTTIPSLDNARKLKLQEISQTATSQTSLEFEPMTPMQPMTMDNMSMSMNPMSMQMGNMSMKMDEPTKSTAKKRFCTQCGQEAEPSDRFCGNCGHKLK